MKSEHTETRHSKKSAPPPTPTSSRGLKSFDFVAAEVTGEVKSVTTTNNSSTLQSTTLMTKQLSEMKVASSNVVQTKKFPRVLDKLYEIDRSFIVNKREHARNTYQKKIKDLEAVLSSEFLKTKSHPTVWSCTIPPFATALVHLATALDHLYIPPVIELMYNNDTLHVEIFLEVLHDIESRWKTLLSYDKFCGLSESELDQDEATLKTLYHNFSAQMRIDVTTSAFPVSNGTVDLIDKLCKAKRVLQLDVMVDQSTSKHINEIHIEKINKILSFSQQSGASSKLSLPYNCPQADIDRLSKSIETNNPDVEIQRHRLMTDVEQRIHSLRI